MLDWNSLSSAVIGGLFTMFGAVISFKYQSKLNEQSEESLIKGVLKGIYDEIDVIWERYNDSIGRHVETLKDGTPFLFQFPCSQDYFNVYSSNTYMLGKIKDVDLRRQIILTYTLAKGMLDNFNMNNHLVTKYENYHRMYYETKKDCYLDISKSSLNQLTIYAAALKEGHNKLKTEVAKLIRMLHKDGVLTS